MQWATRSIVVLMSVLVLSCVTHANDQKSVLSTQRENDHSQVNEGPKALNEAIKIYLEKNPPKAISELVYSKIEKTQPASIPEADREKMLSKIKTNVTPEVLTKMISASLKRNFTAEEINILTNYNDSQLSDVLKKKNEHFRFEVSSEIGLLIAAISG